ncbi:Capsular glucan synthase [compost metagenome]
MNVIYDNIVYSLQNIGGISIYWCELTKRLLKEAEVNSFFIETGLEKDNLCRRTLEIKEQKTLTRNLINLQIERFIAVRTGFNSLDKGTSIFHSSYFRLPLKRDRKNLKIVSTVHDFTHNYYFKGYRGYLHNSLKYKSIKESDAIICVSEHTKRDLINFYPNIDPSRVKVIYNGVSEEFKILEADNNVNRDRYILFVGSRVNYKNFEYAVRLVKELRNMVLYVVGSPFTKEELIMLNKSVSLSRVKLFSNVSNSFLNELYNRAYALIYPSSYEGFGIPLLEAMRSGCVPIAFNSSSIPEVMGNAGILLNSLDIDEGLTAIEEVDQKRESLVKLGLERSSHFSWDLTFKATVDLYKDIL